jgi:protein-S-isoprenylcysteine O-methyltransferase Ste14
MRGIWLRALLYLCIVGGGWLVCLPLAILTLEKGRPAIVLRRTLWALCGAATCTAGAALGLVSGYYLITHGRGTPLPLDPTRELVTSGPYRVVRNPQAIAMTLMVAGEVLAVRSRRLWLLLPLTLLYLEVIIGPWEERQLHARHGGRYLAYKRQLRKWIPRLLST